MRGGSPFPVLARPGSQLFQFACAGLAFGSSSVLSEEPIHPPCEANGPSRSVAAAARKAIPSGPPWRGAPTAGVRSRSEAFRPPLSPAPAPPAYWLLGLSVRSPPPTIEAV